MHIERVADAASDDVADYAALTDVALRSATETERGLYIAESAKVISRAIRAGHRPRSVLMEEKWLAGLEPVLAPFDIPVHLATPDQLEGITGYRVHRGALAAFERPALPDPATLLADARRVVVLEDLVDHTNVGAIFRACAALGVDAVLVTPRCADPLYRRSVRVSMGTVFQVPWTRVTSWPDDVSLLTTAGFEVAALALSDEAVPLDVFSSRLPDRLALVFGAEGDGLSRRTLAAADHVVMIPMAGGVDSLNVAAATAVALWATRPPAV
ncbi:TrmH family RNA methyltransferase [Agromyces aerolatus]|uniref:TrmH family RNA methyltransferase n=1 Tax=Agromyces sp. LY-1074 TaxID=3074080 RepID=UPI00285477B3|nr:MULTISPECIES: RNA methyltransferase [unclassified Agromyces]MDR5700074.1 RNA methyltransferase [Agromyces sp. LY-1074]MDR5706558.1 RNA methyltransferase [Agromyces sp. LY-1358]